jgi:hypothetical protein
MRKFYIAILLFAFISGCEKNFDSVIDVNKDSFQVTSLNDFTSFIYVAGDSSLTIFISLNSSKDISIVFCDIISPGNRKINSDPVLLLDNGKNGDATAGDNKFSGLFPMSSNYAVGVYTINYFVTDKDGITKKVAVHQFTYDNGQANIAPVITNLVLQDTVVRNATFIFTVSASDSNGSGDIQIVYFELFRPDGSPVQNTPDDTIFPMHDDGDSEHYGDNIAGDGVYSFKNSFSATASIGTWRFVFHAKDRGGLLSNAIEKSVVVE